MEKFKNLCGQIPEELHNKVRTEQESLGLTLGKYLEQVLTAHFAAPAPAVRGGDRTLAFQVPEALFQRVKQYLEAHKPLSQKAFVVGLLENALTKWERGEGISSGLNTVGKGEKERTWAVVVPGELFERVKGCLAAHDSMSQRDFVLGLIEQEVSGWESQQAAEQEAEIPQEETDEALSDVGAGQQISEDEPLTEDLEEEFSGFSMVMM